MPAWPRQTDTVAGYLFEHILCRHDRDGCSMHAGGLPRRELIIISPLSSSIRPEMPHLVIEYSDNLTQLDSAGVLASANAALQASGLFEEADIKSRAYASAEFLVGLEPAPRGFVAARLAILSGRSLATKQDLSERLLQALRQELHAGAGLAVQVSVEVVDIDRASYAKAVVEA